MKHPYCLFRRLSFIFLSAGICLAVQDTRQVEEPTFPKTCGILQAPLQSGPDGPVLGQTIEEQDAESDAATRSLTNALGDSGCANKAVVLTLGKDRFHNSFLINPITIPIGVSLIIDAGVTVYASRDAQYFQDPDTLNSSPPIICGTIGAFAPVKGCIALITLSKDSGIYGNGILDGQGNRTLLSGSKAGSTWWDLTHSKGSTSEQASPKMIDAGKAGALASNITLYKITIRNPPYHTVNFNGDGFTAWGVKIQSPWNIPNTDGFDIEGTNMTLYNTTVSVGDQQVAIGAASTSTSNITIERFFGYNKGGITILGNGDGTTPISNVVVKDAFMTADLPSVIGATVNGVSESELKTRYGLQSYGQALPAAMNDNKALQVTFNMNNKTPAEVISHVTYQSVCIQDIAKPFQFIPLNKFSPDSSVPTVQDLMFKNIHILRPSAQFPLMGEGNQKGVPVSPPSAGGYQIAFTAYPPAFTMASTFENVVFDDIDGQSSLLGVTGTASVGVTAIGNVFTTKKNIYPPMLNLLTANTETKTPVDGVSVTLSDNGYAKATRTALPDLAYSCRNRPSFLVGDLFASVESVHRNGSTNFGYVEITEGEPVTINAVLQPAMSQSTLYLDGSYGAKPGLVALASPPLTNAIRFYDGPFPAGTAVLSANGTLASRILKNLNPGLHTITAEYPPDSHYKRVNFGLVTVKVYPRCHSRQHCWKEN